MEETGDLLTDELEITDGVKNNLIETAKWAKFLAVTGLLFCLLMLAASFYAGFYMSPVMAERYGFSIGPAISAIYIFFTVVLFFPCLFLFRFAATIQDSIGNNVQENLETAFFSLKSVFKFLGIVTSVILVFWLISFLIVVIKTI